MSDGHDDSLGSGDDRMEVQKPDNNSSESMDVDDEFDPSWQYLYEEDSPNCYYDDDEVEPFHPDIEDHGEYMDYDSEDDSITPQAPEDPPIITQGSQLLGLGWDWDNIGIGDLGLG